MLERTYRNPHNIILEGYQPTRSGNVDPKRPPRGGSALLPSPAWLQKLARKHTDKSEQ